MHAEDADAEHRTTTTTHVVAVSIKRVAAVAKRETAHTARGVPKYIRPLSIGENIRKYSLALSVSVSLGCRLMTRRDEC